MLSLSTATSSDASSIADAASALEARDAALASLGGYAGETFVAKASDAGRMERVRRFWVLARTSREL